MISVKHPEEAINEAQQSFLNTLPDIQKESHALMFSYGNATYKYHKLDISPTVADFEQWLDGLEDPIKKGMKELGYEKCKSILSFTRFVREINDIGMEEFIKIEMGSDYSKYLFLLKEE